MTDSGEGSAVEDTIKSSSDKTKPAKSSLDNDLDAGGSGAKKDELAVSRRGDLPLKGSKDNDIETTDSIEDQLKNLSTEEEKSWNRLDSVHSTNSYGTGKCMDGMNGSSNDSLAFDDSCASFASFGGSAGEEPGDSMSDLLAEEKASFTNLEPEVTPRRKLLAKPPSNKMIRAPSYRGSNLQLIQESDDL
mmetsp:Transcript_2997/g.8459  ORF Transcript_2997/g.8459 Transcript_2997/m.8459 type:complete len:190 (+) Transcript_2997:159-728(+)